MSQPTLGFALQSVPIPSTDLLSLARAYLDPREFALLSPRAAPKRRAEFIAGRMAARSAIAQFSPENARAVSFAVLRDGSGPTGRPVVVGLKNSGAALNVSISHADGIAVAAASDGAIGIDIASIQNQEPSFLDETFSQLELDVWAEWLGSGASSALTVTVAFAAKEAALKWLGIGFGKPLRAIEVLPGGEAAADWLASWPSLRFPVVVAEPACERSHSLCGELVRIEQSVVLILTVPWRGSDERPRSETALLTRPNGNNEP